MDEVEKLKIMTGERDTDLLSLLYADAVEYVLAYTNRTILPDALKKTIRDLTVIALNRMGTEGESGRSEGGESYSFADAPKHIYGILDRYRLARVGGYAFEKKPGTGLLPQDQEDGKEQ